MIHGPSNRYISSYLWFAVIVATVSVIGGCKGIHLKTDMHPKQGDNVIVKVEIDDADDLDEVTVKVNGVEKGVPHVPSYTFTVDTCKDSTGKYMTNLSLSGEAKWNNGDTDTTGKNIPLTTSSIYREDDTNIGYGDRLEYGDYVAHDADPLAEKVLDRNANKFIYAFHGFGDIYSSYPYLRTQHYWASPGQYTYWAEHYVNSVDFAISFGHGNHHHYGAGVGPSNTVDLSTTEYGAFKPCHIAHSDVTETGDLEYLVFVSCLTLQTTDYDSHPFWYYWFHNDATKMGPRPFTGLHMVLGYTGLRHVDWVTDDGDIIWDSGSCFMKKFGCYLYCGLKVIDAWQLASLEGQCFTPGSDENFTAVIYLSEYENDNLFSAKGDRIYPSYGGMYINHMFW
jgi:hypothetical protein